MKPIGLLMREHRLIERMVAPMTACVRQTRRTGEIDTAFVDLIVEFIRIYADRCHHGKEEDILFRDLEKKPLSDEHRRIMRELIEEHVYGRKTLSRIIAAKERYLDGDADGAVVVAEAIEELAVFYPRHIEKEDRRFFFPAMDYFTEREQNDMLAECYEFDRALVHAYYSEVIERIEAMGAERPAS